MRFGSVLGIILLALFGMAASSGLGIAAAATVPTKVATSGGAGLLEHARPSGGFGTWGDNYRQCMVRLDDVLFHIDRALDGVLKTVSVLDDETVNRRADFPGANSPYGLVVHCCGVLEFWAGQVIAGRVIQRDREAEFFATGQVADLAELVRSQRSKLQDDLAHFDAAAPPVGPLRSRDVGLVYTRTQGGCLMHIYEELAQHRGQLEVTVDVLNSSQSRTAH